MHMYIPTKTIIYGLVHTHILESDTQNITCHGPRQGGMADDKSSEVRGQFEPEFDGICGVWKMCDNVFFTRSFQDPHNQKLQQNSMSGIQQILISPPMVPSFQWGILEFNQQPQRKRSWKHNFFPLFCLLERPGMLVI